MNILPSAPEQLRTTYDLTTKSRQPPDHISEKGCFWPVSDFADRPQTGHSMTVRQREAESRHRLALGWARVKTRSARPPVIAAAH